MQALAPDLERSRLNPSNEKQRGVNRTAVLDSKLDSQSDMHKSKF